MSSKKKRVMTSAIEGMSVADVRKCLADIRKQWQDHSVQNPIRGCHEIACIPKNRTPVMIEEFSFQFISGHHNKRHNAKN
jgi:hypothetical protein